MANVNWSTTSGSLGVINERDFYSKQLEANSQDSTGLTYSHIAGTLPPGIQLTSTGLLQGTPFEVSTRSLYEFVIRASDGTVIADRNFSLQIQGADVPSFSTDSGQLDFADTSLKTSDRTDITSDATDLTADTSRDIVILDGSYVEYQIVATDTDTAAGQTLVYDIVKGKLPPGVTMSSTGLISGVIQLTEDERYGVYGGYSNVYAYDTVGYDPTARTKSRSENFEFVVRVSDGTSSVTQVNNIFVYTADYFRVDNSIITVDQTIHDGYSLVMSMSGNRRPVFLTDSALGTFKHDNNVVIKIDVEDFDKLQGDLNYSIVSGSLPSGLSIDGNTGEIAGTLSRQDAVETTFTFTIRASRTPYPNVTVYGERTFTMTVVGEIEVGIEFTTSANLGTVTAGIPSLLSVQAEAAETNRVLEYTVTAGSLPTGLTLSRAGNIIGTVDLSEFTTVDQNAITFDTNTLSFDREYTFTIRANDQYQSTATTREFTLKVSLPYGVEYGSMYAQGLINNKANSLSDRDTFYQLAQDPNINKEEFIFRPEDPNFGMQTSAEMLLIAGLEHQTITTLQQQMEQNHTPKTLYFGDIKTAVAKEGSATKYEVVYIEMKDPLVNNAGEAISTSVDLRNAVTKPIIGPLADASRITADYDVYNVTTNSGLSFSISGSKIRYSNPLSADIGTFEKLYPNAVANMRSRMKSLGQKEYNHLPLWMRTSQDDSGVPLGYKMAVVLAYCKPGKSEIVKRRVLDKSIDFKKIDYKIDRYVVSGHKVDTGTISPDGSTTTFEMNEIVHEEEIKVRENATVLIYGDQITADNNLTPLYLSTDSSLRSADYEPQFRLQHDGSSKKTSIVFTNAPSSESKIRVERKGDKYLAFKRKLEE